MASGNLIQNSSFELGLVAWQAENVVAVKGEAHSGYYYALLGGNEQHPSSLSQTIKISGKRVYLLSMFAACRGPASDLHILLSWLDKKGRDLGVGLSFDLLGKSLPTQPQWGYYIDFTGKSPEETRYARLTISKELGGAVCLDDLLFFRQNC